MDTRIRKSFLTGNLIVGRKLAVFSILVEELKRERGKKKERERKCIYIDIHIYIYIFFSTEETKLFLRKLSFCP